MTTIADPGLQKLRYAIWLVKEARIPEAEACYAELLRQHPELPRYLGWPAFSLALEEAGYELQAQEAVRRWQALRSTH